MKQRVGVFKLSFARAGRWCCRALCDSAGAGPALGPLPPCGHTGAVPAPLRPARRPARGAAAVSRSVPPCPLLCHRSVPHCVTLCPCGFVPGLPGTVPHSPRPASLHRLWARQGEMDPSGARVWVREAGTAGRHKMPRKSEGNCSTLMKGDEKPYQQLECSNNSSQQSSHARWVSVSEESQALRGERPSRCCGCGSASPSPGSPQPSAPCPLRNRALRGSHSPQVLRTEKTHRPHQKSTCILCHNWQVLQLVDLCMQKFDSGYCYLLITFIKSLILINWQNMWGCYGSNSSLYVLMTENGNNSVCVFSASGCAMAPCGCWGCAAHVDSEAGLASPRALQTSYTCSFLIFDESLLSILFVFHFSADSLFHEAETSGKVRLIE